MSIFNALEQAIQIYPYLSFVGITRNEIPALYLDLMTWKRFSDISVGKIKNCGWNNHTNWYIFDW